MTLNYKYERFSSKLVPEHALNYYNQIRRPQRELIHHRSLFLGIFIGSFFAVISLLILLPSLPLFYSATPRISDNNDKNIQSGNTDLIVNLYDNVRILCMVFTYEKNFKSKAYVVKRTWGSRCNKLLFMSNTLDPNSLIDVTVLDFSETRDNLWKKTKLSFKHAYDHYLNDYDWFLKADDDTYVIMENLRHYLYPYPSDVPLIFGHQFSGYYMSGGAGYILSREAVKLFIEKAVNDKANCYQFSDGAEDKIIGQCLHNAINVTFGDTRDESGKERFFPLYIEYLMNERDPDLQFWYWSDNEYYHNETGLACCSNTAISFHYMTPSKILAAEYLLYHMRVHKMEVALKDLPSKFTKNDVNIMFPRKNIGRKF